MLDGLDSINWSELTHAYGPARDVPGLLRDLANGSHEVIGTLYGNIWHQGTVYEATAPAVPFLLEILSDPDCSCRCDILGLLAHLATGSSYLAAHQDMEWYHNERETDAFREQLGRERRWVQNAHAAVIAGTPVYAELLADRTPAVRAMAAHVLGVCTERAAEIESVLQEQIRTDPDPVPRASAVMELGTLWARAECRARQEAPLDERTAVFVRIMRGTEQPPLVRFVAALQVACRGGADYFDESLDVFRATIDASAEGYALLPATEGGNPRDAVSGALSRFPEIELRWLFEWLRHPDPGQRAEAVFSLKTFCQRWRFAPERVVPVLVELLTDPDAAVRDQVARTIPELGRARFLAVEPLESLLVRTDGGVKKAAQRVLTAVRDRKNEYAPENWNSPPRKRFNVTRAIQLIEEQFDLRRSNDHYELADAARCMQLLGTSAIEAVPALRRCLNHESQWVRIRAAQAVWAITGDAELILPTVLEELQCRPVGILAAELIGEMRARAAVPALKRIVSSETRLVRCGADDSWIDQDEGFAEAARRALERIESEPGSVE